MQEKMFNIFHMVENMMPPKDECGSRSFSLRGFDGRIQTLACETSLDSAKEQLERIPSVIVSPEYKNYQKALDTVDASFARVYKILNTYRRNKAINSCDESSKVYERFMSDQAKKHGINDRDIMKLTFYFLDDNDAKHNILNGFPEDKLAQEKRNISNIITLVMEKPLDNPVAPIKISIESPNAWGFSFKKLEEYPGIKKQVERSLDVMDNLCCGNYAAGPNLEAYIAFVDHWKWWTSADFPNANNFTAYLKGNMEAGQVIAADTAERKESRAKYNSPHMSEEAHAYYSAKNFMDALNNCLNFDNFNEYVQFVGFQPKGPQEVPEISLFADYLALKMQNPHFTSRLQR